MKNIIAPLYQRAEFLPNVTKVDSIDDDFVLLDSPIISSVLDHPFKLDVTTAVICLKGTARVMINLKSYETHVPCFMIVLPNQVLQYEYVSEDFSGLFIIMSRRFTESLNIQEKFPVFFSVHNNPFIPLSEAELEAMMNYYGMMQRTIRVKDNPYRIEIAKHLTTAFFYGLGYHFHEMREESVKSRQKMLTEKFLTLVQVHYKERRNVAFYADRLRLTPKYLSKVIKDSSGTSASDWIDSYVILEAKALLKSTDMTLQQISDELNFPSQSFFGKYFKRLVGVSPREYRKT